MINWRKHEENCKKSKYYKDYDMQWQKHSTSTKKRPDGFGINRDNPKDRVVGDAKWCVEAKKKHIDQIQNYKQHPFYSKKGVLHYPQNAKISKNVRDYAKQKNVIITRTKRKKIKEPSGLLKILIEQEYKR